MEGNAAQIGLRERQVRRLAKIAAVSKIAQCVGPLSKGLSACLLMDLSSC